VSQVEDRTDKSADMQPTSAQADGNPDSVSERPQLAPDVMLRGEMKDSAYEQQQWLAERSGTFVQLTELLYRVAEQANGEHTLEEMAAGVSEATDRVVSADNIRQLLSGKLIPLGLVTTADGSVIAAAPGSTEQPGMRSPLKINMRVRMMSPRLIAPFTVVLRWLFWPPVLGAVLLVAAAVQVWLFAVHGVANSIHQVLYHPGLMLALLGIIVVGTVFHELGHASALRYGGGEVRGIGVGLYLVYPAFYTDVTDNYRLARWGKVRTDLGGFYFNMIFGIIMVGLYALTRQDFLLLVIMLIDIEILHQTLPIARLDGYWALADLTGMPDFFSQIMPFLRSVLPFLSEKGPGIANLKRWVRVVFAIYIIITVPLLSFLAFLMIKGVPRVLATAWDSGSKQAASLSTAHAHGDVLGTITSAVQLLVLALPTFGLLYVLFNLTRRGFGALWRWSKPTVGRRITGSAVTVGIVAFLALLWVPQIPLPRPHNRSPLYDKQTYTPIRLGERGTLGDAVRSVPVFRRIIPARVFAPVAPIAPVRVVVTPAKSRAIVKPTAAPHAKASPTPAVRPTAAPPAVIAPTAAPTAAPALAPTVTPVAASTQPAAPPPTVGSTFGPTLVPQGVPPAPTAPPVQQPTVAPPVQQQATVPPAPPVQQPTTAP